MKDIKRRVFQLRNLFCIILLFIFLVPVLAQGKEKKALTPTPAFYTGNLENGFTYFIKPLESGKKVHMELVVKSGAQRQSEGEWELSHFVEHLAVAHFKNKSFQSDGGIGEYLKTRKVELGGSAHFDQTRYHFIFPQGKHDLRDTGLTYLSNIAFGQLELDQDILEAEKAVLFQEVIQGAWRNYNSRTVDALLSDCLMKPISPDSLWKHIKTFNIDQAQQFFKKWYRPDLSVLIIVGPIDDLEELTTEIKKAFSSSGAKTNNLIESCSEKFLERPPQLVVVNNNSNLTEDRREVRFHIHIRDKKKLTKLSRAQWGWLKPIINRSINDKLLGDEDNYIKRYSAHAYWHKVLPVLDILISEEMDQGGQGFKETLALLKELKVNGISEEQWSAIKHQKIQELHNKDTTSINYWMHQLRQEAISGKEVGLQEELIAWWTGFSLKDYNKILNHFIPGTPDDIGAIAPLDSLKNEVYWETKIKSWLNPTTSVDKNIMSSDDFLVLDAELKERGYEELHKDIFGSRVFRLSNGVQVVIKEFPQPMSSEGSISIKGFRKKGASDLPEEMYFAAMLSPDVIRHMGIDSLNKFQLQKFLSSTSISRLSPYVTYTESGIQGRSEGKDIETFFQILSKFLTSSRIDNIAFSDWQRREWMDYLYPKVGRENSDFTAAVGKKLKIPAVFLSVSERYIPTQEIDIGEAYLAYRLLFGQANEFTFLISSSLESSKLLPLVDRYLGNLPNFVDGDKSLKIPRNYKYPKGPKRDTLKIPSIPKENIMLSFQYLKSVELSDWKTRLHLKIWAEILSTRVYLLRDEHRRGMYSVGTNYIANDEVCRPGIAITIPILEEQGSLILKDIDNIILEILQQPLNRDYLDEVLQQRILPKYAVELEKNEKGILESLYKYYRFEIFPPENSVVKDYILSLNPEILMEFARQFFIEENMYVFIGKSQVR